MANANRINTVQLSALRRVASDPDKPIGADRCTCKALAVRGFAVEQPNGEFLITLAGIERARFKADIHVKRDGVTYSPTLMEDL